MHTLQLVKLQQRQPLQLRLGYYPPINCRYLSRLVVSGLWVHRLTSNRLRTRQPYGIISRYVSLLDKLPSESEHERPGNTGALVMGDQTHSQLINVVGASYRHNCVLSLYHWLMTKLGSKTPNSSADAERSDTRSLIASKTWNRFWLAVRTRRPSLFPITLLWSSNDG